MILRHFAVMLGVIVGCMVSIGPVSAQVVALGASNTEGKGVGSSEAFPAQLQAMLRAKGAAMVVTNAGVSGDTTGGMLARLASAVPQGTRIVIVQYGGNDARKGDAGSRAANIAAIENQLHTRHIKILRADGLVVAALRAGMMQPDGIHLTVAGHQRVAAQLIQSIR
jgi:acyl-CoA thioesterase-1